jgi:tyrosine-protein phosphatase SIW14
MHKNKEPKAGSGRWGRGVVLLVGIVVGYLGQAYRSETGIFEANRNRDWRAEWDSKRQWAQGRSLRGVPNFHKVSENLYRSAQPSAEGMERLVEMGVKTVVNLRDNHSDRDEIGGLNLAYEHIEMEADDPLDEDMVRFLRIVSDKERGPFLVHCKHGADRTGTMCGVYRIVIEGWSKEEAIEEMTKGGFGFHRWWNDLKIYIRELDVEQIKKSAGLQD